MKANDTSAFDPIYFRLAGLAPGQRSKVVGVTSPGRGDGSTTIAVGLARSAFRAGAGPVLVIDAAPRGQRVASQLGVKTEPPRSPVQPKGRGEGSVESHIVTCDGLGVDVLTLGASEVAGSDAERWERALEGLRSKYRFIVVDAADLESPVPVVWQHHVDELVLVVDTTRATVESLVRLRKDLVGSKVRIDGFALNKRRYHVPDFLYRFI